MIVRAVRVFFSSGGGVRRDRERVRFTAYSSIQFRTVQIQLVGRVYSISRTLESRLGHVCRSESDSLFRSDAEGAAILYVMIGGRAGACLFRPKDNGKSKEQSVP